MRTQQFSQTVLFLSGRVFIVLLVAIILYWVYFFYQPFVLVFNYKITNPLFSYVDGMALWLYLIFYFAVVSLVNVFVLLTFSWYYSFYKERIAIQRSNYEVLFNEQLINYIYIDFLHDVGHVGDFILFFKHNTESKLSQDVLLTVMARQQEMIAENLSHKFTILIEKLGLDTRLEAFLYSRNISENVIAMKLLSYLRIKNHNDRIKKMVNSKNYVLRTEAMAALIRLSDMNHLELLFSQQHYLSMLDVNVIVNAVEKNLKADIDYLNLLTARSTRVVSIGLMLVKIRNKIEFKPQIKAAFGYNDGLIHQIAWEALVDMANTHDDYQFLIKRFDIEDYNSKLYFLKRIERYQHDDEFFGFLDKVIQKEHLHLKIAALKVYFDNYIERMVVYQNSSDRDISQAYREVVDLNIF